MFLPSHEDVVSLVQAVVVKCVGVKGLGVLVKRQKFALKQILKGTLIFIRKQ